MSEPVTVRFLAPVFNVPPRARTPRLTYVPMEAPMRVRTIAKEDAAIGPRLPAPGGRTLTSVVVDGSIWLRVRKKDEGKPNEDLSGDRFVAWLQGDPLEDALDRTEVGHHFARTPLVARLPHYQGHGRSAFAAGRNLGEILVDGRARALVAAKAYVENEVAIIDGIARIRMPAPTAYHDARTGRMRLFRHPGARNTTAGVGDAMPFRVDRLAAMAAFHHPGLAFGDVPTDWPADTFEGLAFARDADVHQFVGQALGRLLDKLDTMHHLDCPYPADRLARMRELQGYSSLGMLADDELEPACDLIVAAVNDLPDAHVGTFWNDVVRYARTVAIPILQDRRGLAAEDAEALAAIAP